MSNSYTFPPSPTPPWARPVVSPVNHTLVEDGAISLNTITTFLNSTEPKAEVDDVVPPHIATIAAPNHSGQRKIIQIQSGTVENTVVWRVNGNFVGFVALQLDSLGQSVELLSAEDGFWHVIGGNAEKLDA